MFISPRNSLEGQLSLFDKTDCQFLAFAKPLRGLVRPWLQEREMKAIEVDPVETWFPEQDVEPFPYEKTFEQAEWDPLVVLHTSGSTGIPKPVVIRQGLIAMNDIHNDLPTFGNGFEPWLRGLAKASRKTFSPSKLTTQIPEAYSSICSYVSSAPFPCGRIISLHLLRIIL